MSANDKATARAIEHPCDYCGREVEGSWFAPCPSGDCPSHDPIASLTSQNAAMKARVEELEKALAVASLWERLDEGGCCKGYFCFKCQAHGWADELKHRSGCEIAALINCPTQGVCECGHHEDGHSKEGDCYDSRGRSPSCHCKTYTPTAGAEK